MKKRITMKQRRHQDYLRRKGMVTARKYDSELLKYRRKELRTVLEKCQDYNRWSWDSVFRGSFAEPYLQGWYESLYIDAGVPAAKSAARDLSNAKSDDSAVLLDAWEEGISDYIRLNAGAKITSVQGTMRDELVKIVQRIMNDNPGAGIEKLTQLIYRESNKLLEWQVRRIAQTETMIALAEGGNIAAKSLEIGFTKTWCNSGNANVRETHIILDGITVDEDEPFESEGSLLMYPHDGSLGAAPGEIINCACSCIRLPK